MLDLILPPLRRTSLEAAQFAIAVHAGQTDKAGMDYVEHLRRVAGRVRNEALKCPFWNDDDASDACQMAWLHDTIEDTPNVTVNTLLREGFSERVAAGVSVLTKAEPPLPYRIYISRLADIGNLHEILVKLADVEDNSDPERLALLDEATRERLTKKYAGAAETLRVAARKRGWQG